MKEITGKISNGVISFSHPREYSGNMFKIDIPDIEKKPPFTIEYFFTTSHLVYSFENIEYNKGYSFLSIPRDNKGFKSGEMSFSYKGTNYKIAISFIKKDDRLIGMAFKNETIDDYNLLLYFTESLVNAQLDYFSFKYNIPIELLKIKIKNNENYDIVLFLRVPFKSVIINHFDLNNIKHINFELRPLISLYREAINSNSFTYKIFCFFKIYEGLKKIRSTFKGERKKRKLKETDFTTTYFKIYIDKKYNYILNDLWEKYRNKIGHFETFDDNRLDVLYIDTKNNINQTLEINTASELMRILLKDLISDELEFFKKSNANKGYTQ